MEIEKRSIHKSNMPVTIEQQFVVEEDHNLPEYKPDIVKILQSKSAVELHDITVEDGVVILKGNVGIDVLYEGEQESIDSLHGSIPFHERVILGEGTAKALEGENQGILKEFVSVKPVVEDVGIVVINTRKISLRGICSLCVGVNEREMLQLPIAPKGNVSDLEVLLEEKTVQKLVEQKKDRIHFQEDITLPKDKMNIGQVIWEDMQFLEWNERNVGDGIDISAMLHLFILYKADANGAYVWYETQVPVTEHITCQMPKAGGFFWCRPLITQTQVDVREDFDGEARVLSCEGYVQVDIMAWQEETVELLKDAYSLSSELSMRGKLENLCQIKMKNDTILPVETEVHLPGNKEVQELCQIKARIRSVSVDWVDHGIKVKGQWEADVLYVTEEENPVFSSERVEASFEGEIEAKDVSVGDIIDMDAFVYRMQCSVGEGGKLYLRGEVMTRMLSFDKEEFWLADGFVEEELQMQKVNQQPGMIGYVVQKQDNLWDIAKKFHTTKNKLMQANSLENDHIVEGQKLLVMKHLAFKEWDSFADI